MCLEGEYNMRIYNQYMVEQEGMRFPINIGDKIVVIIDGEHNNEKIMGTIKDIEPDDFIVVDEKIIDLSNVECLGKIS